MENTHSIKELTAYFENLNLYSREEKKVLNNYFENTPLERVKFDFTPLPESKVV